MAPHVFCSLLTVRNCPRSRFRVSHPQPWIFSVERTLAPQRLLRESFLFVLGDGSGSAPSGPVWPPAPEETLLLPPPLSRPLVCPLGLVSAVPSVVSVPPPCVRALPLLGCLACVSTRDRHCLHSCGTFRRPGGVFRSPFSDLPHPPLVPLPGSARRSTCPSPHSSRGCLVVTVALAGGFL